VRLPRALQTLRPSRQFGPRAAAFFLMAALVGVPAGALRVLCVGGSCSQQARAAGSAPFCSLPSGLRDSIERGFREERSPELMVVSGDVGVRGGTGFESSDSPAWPSISNTEAEYVPLMFAGRGVNTGVRIPLSTGIVNTADTIAEVMEIRRPHPDVRAGNAIPGVSSGEPPKLVLEVVLKDVGSAELEARAADMPMLEELQSSGPGTFRAHVSSLPADPAAAMATIGTGGLPYQHGVTGTLVRNYRGELVSSWPLGARAKTGYDKRFPGTVIATLGDHLDEVTDQKALIGLVGTQRSDRGLIGAGWYLGGDRDDVRLIDDRASPGAVTLAARDLLNRGYGRDRVPDLLAVTLKGSPREVDAALRELFRAGRAATDGDFAIVVTATGRASLTENGATVTSSMLERQVERRVPGQTRVVEATAPGGIFIDQKVLAQRGMSDDPIVDALIDVKAEGERLFVDVFPSVAVSFARYC
jgi:hypothetical protein